MQINHQSYIRRLPSMVLVVLANSYGLPVSILILLWLLTGEGFLFVKVFVNTLPFPLLPALFFALLTAIFRKWRSFLFNILPLIVFFVLYGEIFFNGSQSENTPDTITVLSYNLLHQNPDFASTASIIESTAADIIGLQEVSATTQIALDSYATEEYPYRAYTQITEDRHGEYILSRWSLSEIHTERPLNALIETEHGNLWLFNLHLSWPFGGQGFSTDNRSRAVENLLQMTQGYDVPIVILGDFNMTEATSDYRRMRVAFDDVFRKTNTGLGFTYPNIPTSRWFPTLLRLDYVFTTPDIIPIESHVIYEGSSDHFPLWAKLTIEQD